MTVYGLDGVQAAVARERPILIDLVSYLITAR